MEIFQQLDAPAMIRQGLRHLLPDYRFLARTNPELDPLEAAFVTVISAGVRGGSAVTSSENVHVTVYAADLHSAREIATVIDGLLLDPHIEWGFFMSPGAGLVVSPDDSTGGFVASVTVVAEAPRIERFLS